MTIIRPLVLATIALLLAGCATASALRNGGGLIGNGPACTKNCGSITIYENGQKKVIKLN